jgi:hypothetical protein
MIASGSGAGADVRAEKEKLSRFADPGEDFRDFQFEL